MTDLSMSTGPGSADGTAADPVVLTRASPDGTAAGSRLGSETLATGRPSSAVPPRADRPRSALLDSPLYAPEKPTMTHTEPHLVTLPSPSLQATPGSVSLHDLPPLLQRYMPPRGAMQAVIGGRSAIDLPRLELADVHQARAFLLRYGFDIDNPDHQRVVDRIRAEAIGFVRGVLLSRLDLEVPEWLDAVPVLELLLIAAVDPRTTPDPAVQLRQAWACALLRVMHTFAHVENYFQHAFYPQIREAILERFVAQVATREDGSQVLKGRSEDVPLERFEVKEAKPLRSVVLKLLHKAENVATDLFDHIGVRIIVDRPVEALFAVRALLETHTIMFANIKPTRSRNSLLDVDQLAAEVQALAQQVRSGQLDEAAAADRVAGFRVPPGDGGPAAWNAHSSARYRSIQFTCRQMIRITNPLWARLTRAQAAAHELLSGEARERMLEELDLLGVEKQIQFFFPYEVQIMDRASHEEALRGRASYREYKQRQVATVRRRVLGRVMTLSGHAGAPRRLRDSVELPTLRELLGTR